MAACPVDTAPLAPAVKDAIERALADERAAEARYAIAVAKLGTGGPLERIERAERRHSSRLESLLVAHGLAIPASAPPSTAAPKSVGEACRAGVAAEKTNIAMYDELLKASLPADVRCVFEHLRSASRDRHLPALERCAP
jgi:hypothetical protein